MRLLIATTLLLLLAAPAWGAQCAYPDGDADLGTYWWDSPGDGVEHFSLIDEDTSCDDSYGGDYIVDNDGDAYILTLTNFTDPASSTGHTFSCIVTHVAGAPTFTIGLYQGGTKINTSTSCSVVVTAENPSTEKLECAINGTEADSITDYTDLNLLLTGNGANTYVVSCHMTVPDVAAASRRVIIVQ